MGIHLLNMDIRRSLNFREAGQLMSPLVWFADLRFLQE